MNLHVVLASTRQGRAGGAVADWFHNVALHHGGFNVELIDLADVDLPLFDEPRHPRLQQYEHEHTKAWSAIVQRADAFVFVTPEYNFSAPPALVNALDFVSKEWGYKAAGVVSYGGVSAGLRGAQVTRAMLTGLRMMVVPEAVALPFFSKQIDAGTGVFDPGELQEKAGRAMLDELLKWATVLRPLRGG